MRARSALVFALPLLGFVYACENDEVGGSGASFDGGTGFDASTTEPDGGAPTDAQAPDATASGVVVNVRTAGVPVANVAVLFHDAAGAVTGQAKSDAAGRVAIDPAPAMVTVVGSASGAPTALLTYLGVANGDVLNIEIPPTPTEVPSVGAFDVTFTAPTPTAPSYEAHVNGDCIQTASDLTAAIRVALYPSCVRPNNLLLGVATDVSGVPLQFAFKKGEAAPAAGQTRAVQLPAWAAPQTTVVTAVNVPPGASADASFSMIAEGAVFQVGYPTGAMNEGGMTYRWPSGFVDATSAKVVVRPANGNASQILAKRAAPTTITAFDFSLALPALTDVKAQGATRPDVTIAAAQPLSAADGVVVALDWSFLDASENFVVRRWTFVVPPTQTAFKVPALPSELASFAPTNPTVSAAAGAFDADAVLGYAQAKSLPLPVAGPPPQLDENAVLPANGTLRASLFGSLSFTLD